MKLVATDIAKLCPINTLTILWDNLIDIRDLAYDKAQCIEDFIYNNYELYVFQQAVLC